MPSKLEVNLTITTLSAPLVSLLHPSPPPSPEVAQEGGPYLYMPLVVLPRVGWIPPEISVPLVTH